ncbi:MAG: hypothetical protein U0835_18645 [Isosphaeraceae bacterium]
MRPKHTPCGGLRRREFLAAAAAAVPAIEGVRLVSAAEPQAAKRVVAAAPGALGLPARTPAA